MVRLAALMLLASLLSVAGVAGAEPAGTPACDASVAKRANPDLDKLFEELKREPNAKAATRITRRIWAEWFDSGSDTVNLLLNWSQEAIEKEKFEVALDLLDQVVVLDPGFAEGWNRRATLHFMMDRYDKSMADIACTLLLEPRHFGAWSGMAAIYKNSGLKEKALEAYLKVLEFYPADVNAQKAVLELSEELAKDAI